MKIANTYIKRALFFTFFIMFYNSNTSYAQQQPDWQQQFDSPINWYHLSKTGILIVCTKNALYGLDPYKKTKWEIPELANMNGDNYRELDSLPVAEIKEIPEKATVQKKLNGFLKQFDPVAKADLKFWYINPLTGSILFDSRTAENIRITSKKIIPLLNAVWIEGEADSKRVMGLADLSTGKLKWYKEKPVHLNKFTFRDNFSSLLVDPEQNIILTYAGTTYRYNSNTGEIMWKRDSAINNPMFFGNDKDKFFGNYKGLCEFDLKTGEYISGDTMTDLNARLAYKDYLEGDSHKGMSSNLLAYTSSQAKVNADNFLLIGGPNFGDYSFNYYNLESMKPLWSQCPSFLPYSIKNVFVVKDKYLVTLRDANKQNAIALVNSDGKQVWNEPIKMPAKLNFLYTDYGIVYITDSYANILDPESGRSLLPKSLNFQSSDTVLFANDTKHNAVIFYANNSLYKMDYKNPSVSEIVDRIEFKGNAVEKMPVQLDMVDNGYFIASSQNVLLSDFDGKIIYKKYYQPSGLPDWLTSSFQLAASLAIGYLTYGSGSRKITNEMWRGNFISTDDYLNSSVLNYYSPGLGNGLLLNSALGNTFERQNVRIESAYKYKDVKPVYAKLPDNKNGFYFIEKNTGNTLSTLELNDKDPDCKLDLLSNGLYYLPDSKNVYYYSLIKK